MSILVHVSLSGGELIAELSDGRVVRRCDHVDFALALTTAGAAADALSFQWRPGSSMITAGKKAAICAEMRRLERSAN